MQPRTNPPGVRIGQGQHVSDLDWKIRDAAQKPGPGAYQMVGVPNAHQLPRTDKEWSSYVAYYPEMRYRET